MYASEYPEEVAKLCRLIYASGDNLQKEKLRGLIKTPKLLSIVKSYEMGLVVELQLANKRETKLFHEDHPEPQTDTLVKEQYEFSEGQQILSLRRLPIPPREHCYLSLNKAKFGRLR